MSQRAKAPQLNGKRYPRRDCQDCGGEGFVPIYAFGTVSAGAKYRKCKCWRFVNFASSNSTRSGETIDGKQLACGDSQ